MNGQQQIADLIRLSPEEVFGLDMEEMMKLDMGIYQNIIEEPVHPVHGFIYSRSSGDNSYYYTHEWPVKLSARNGWNMNGPKMYVKVLFSLAVADCNIKLQKTLD